MRVAVFLQDLQDFDAGQGGLETGFFQIQAFHKNHLCRIGQLPIHRRNTLTEHALPGVPCAAFTRQHYSQSRDAMQKLLIYLTVSGAIVLTACSAHRPPVQQGNVWTPELLQALQPGMTRRQVTFLLGSPTLQDPFHPDRWDYVYWFKEKGKEAEHRRLSLFFSAGQLTRTDPPLPHADAQQ
ncbi:MAG TPA: outer membrane protein assembly factor BamE [Gammaproteobacteria bacterium]|nr:outer membrane protein assembly factor BamE [Gammaproteobacteria bacterium]